MSHNLVNVLVLGPKFPTYLSSLSSVMALLQSPSHGGIPQDAFEPHNLLVSFTDTNSYSDDFESTCSTPYVSAPSSPGRGYTSNHGGYFFSAPASPMHFVISSAPSTTCPSTQPLDTSSFEFDSRFSPNGSVAVGSMSSADELFLNGQIRPMKLSSHLQRPQILAPLLDLDEDEEHEEERDKATLKEHSDTVLRRGRDLKLRSRSLNRKSRSLSPIRNAEFQALQQEEEDDEVKTKRVDDLILNLQEDFAGAKQSETTTVSTETTPSPSASSSRSSSTGRNSKKWIFLKELLYRSKSEGRGGNSREKFWHSISSLAPSKEKPPPPASKEKKAEKQKRSSKQAGRPTNGVAAAKRRVPAPSPHELHYTAYRAQAEELKKRTYLPYRQGLLGCLGLSFKGYGAFSGLGRDLNPVSSG